jgi:hypothetical protein
MHTPLQLLCPIHAKQQGKVRTHTIITNGVSKPSAIKDNLQNNDTGFEWPAARDRHEVSPHKYPIGVSSSSVQYRN